MLRTFKKLALRRNTVRTLTETDLAIAHGNGAADTPCTGSREASSCIVEAAAGDPQPGAK